MKRVGEKHIVIDLKVEYIWLKSQQNILCFLRGVDEILMVISISNSDDGGIKFIWEMSDYMCSEKEPMLKKILPGCHLGNKKSITRYIIKGEILCLTVFTK